MNKVKTAIAAGTPIFVTEFGICDASGNGGFDTANADAWIELLDGYNISYACWSLCNKNESASYLSTSCTKTTGGWVESDLATTGIWLVNTYRAHEDAENGTVTINNTGDADTVLVSAAFENGANSNFEITNNLSGNISAGGSGSVTIAAKTGLKAGTTVITVTSEHGLKKTFKLQVVKKAITKIKLTGSKKMKVKAKQKLKVAVTPNKKYISTNFIWKSSNEKIATVSGSGQVKALKKGKVKITVYATDGSGKKASVSIQVK